MTRSGAFSLLRLAAAFLAAGVTVSAASEAFARPEISVQPVVGEVRGQIRRQVARTVRARGLRVTTEVPAAEGTGQYYTWARELGLRAFVTGEIEKLGRRQRATFLVWSGHNGSVVGRWTVTAPAKQLPRAIARGFWPRLGRSFKRAYLPPEWRQQKLPPAPTMRIDAGYAQDESVEGRRFASGRRRIR
ncbi:MAG TPA: hypothetical protein VGF45_09575 [Polyangia bacterium]